MTVAGHVRILLAAMAVILAGACGGGEPDRARPAVPTNPSDWALHFRLQQLEKATGSPLVVRWWFDGFLRCAGYARKYPEMPAPEDCRRVAMLDVEDAPLRAKLLVLALMLDDLGVDLRKRALTSARDRPGPYVREIAYVYPLLRGKRGAALRAHLLPALGVLPPGPAGVPVLEDALRAGDWQTQVLALRAVRSYLADTDEFCAAIAKHLVSPIPDVKWEAAASGLGCTSIQDRAHALFSEALAGNDDAWALRALRGAPGVPVSLWKEVARKLLDGTMKPLLKMPAEVAPPRYACFDAYMTLATTKREPWQIAYLHALDPEAVRRAEDERDDPCIRAIGLLRADRGDLTDEVAASVALSLNWMWGPYAIREAMRLAGTFETSSALGKFVKPIVPWVRTDWRGEEAVAWLLDHLEVSRGVVLELLGGGDRVVVERLVAGIRGSPEVRTALYEDLRVLEDQTGDSWRKRLLLDVLED